MSEPTEEDVSTWGIFASDRMKKENKVDSSSVWCFSPLEEVRDNMFKTNYNKDKIKFIKGKVEDTLNSVNVPKNVPKKTSLLRLDTDWYESTKV
ncbi:hypothetical protein DID78_01605 [Candidatus Marinamargulisbacteria bacterium SCGC AG-343-D04]|nr:hypothetical protein DID78_01605 [Candidatus Marinamargulisbacteria bacterium SCGC AG-343-D04]